MTSTSFFGGFCTIRGGGSSYSISSMMGSGIDFFLLPGFFMLRGFKTCYAVLFLFLGRGFGFYCFFFGSLYSSFHNGDLGSDVTGETGDDGYSSETTGLSVNSSTIFLSDFTLMTLLVASLGTVTVLTGYFLLILSLHPQSFYFLSL